MTRIWHLASRPHGAPQPENFVLQETTAAVLAPGMVRVRNSWLSVDPYMRGLLEDSNPYMPTLGLGAAMIGGAIGAVVESRNNLFKVGDIVSHRVGWRDESVLKPEEIAALPKADVPPQRFLGHLGMPGMTAYSGLLFVAEPKSGETIFVSGAAGAVGSAVVQIAKIKGLTVIASAGGPDKCAFLREIGADVAIDYRAPGSMDDKLSAAAPEGIDIYFDNVGGDHLDAALLCAKRHARFALCGMVGVYNAAKPMVLKNILHTIRAKPKMQCFSAPDYYHRRDEFLTDMIPWVENGLIRSQETIHEGLESTPIAFCDIFKGGNTGKMLVRL
jgi:NADPH-dependent curcumin reductase CurA